MRKLDILKLATIALLAIGIIALIWIAIQPRGNGDFRPDPVSNAGSLTRDLATKKGMYDETRIVTFSSGKTISNISLAEATKGNLQPEDICVLAGDFKSNFGEGKNWNGLEGISLVYKGTQSQKVVVAGICDTGSEMVKPNYFELYAGGKIKKEWVNVCGCVNSSVNTTCCVVVLKKPGN